MPMIETFLCLCCVLFTYYFQAFCEWSPPCWKAINFDSNFFSSNDHNVDIAVLNSTLKYYTSHLSIYMLTLCKWEFHKIIAYVIR